MLCRLLEVKGAIISPVKRSCTPSRAQSLRHQALSGASEEGNRCHDGRSCPIGGPQTPVIHTDSTFSIVLSPDSIAGTSQQGRLQAAMHPCRKSGEKALKRSGYGKCKALQNYSQISVEY